MKKVLFLIESLEPAAGGPAAEIARLTSVLANDLSLGQGIVAATPEQSNLTIERSVDFYYTGKVSFPGLSWLKAVANLRKIAKNYDVLFVTGIWGPLDGLSIKFFWPRNKAFYIRVCGMLEPYILNRNKPKKDIARALYVNRNIEKANGLIVNSLPEASNLVSLGISRDKIHVIRNGIKKSEVGFSRDQVRNELGIRENEKVLLYMGRIHPKKGLDLLLKALPKTSFNKEGFRLLVAGDFSDSEYQQIILDLVKNSELKCEITFLGMVTGERKNRILGASDCFILPSHSEGLPNAVIEALSYGMPAIITEGCNIPEIAEYEAGKVIVLSEECLVESVNWFCDEPESVKMASLKALKLISERFSPEVMAESYSKLIYDRN